MKSEKMKDKEMYLIDWYKKVVFDNFANFRGRASRNEYWYFIVANVLIAFFSMIFMAVFASGEMENFATGILIAVFIYFLVIIIPSLAVMVRRLHDIDKSGWYLLINLIPAIGSVCVLIATCLNGTVGDNKYGRDPKIPFSELDEIGKTENK